MLRRSRTAFTVLETAIAMAIFLIALAAIYGLVRLAGKTGQSVETVHAAVTHAELAMAALTQDLRAMLPPDPSRGVVPYRVAPSGRAFAFFRVEEARGELRARPVLYESRPTPAGNFTLLRDGQRVGGVLLASFRVEELRVEGEGAPGGGPAVLPRAAAANPRLRVELEGASADLPRSQLPADGVHRLAQMFAVPETSPAATLDLPPVARELARKAVRIDGTLPDVQSL